MEYAVVFYFDEIIEEKINLLIEKTASETENKYMVVNKIPPHITISLFQYDEDIDTIMRIIDNNISTFNKDKIILASIGVFNQSVLFLAPVVNNYLVESNKKINEIIRANDKIKLDKNYIENQWIPHISLGVRLNENELIKGVKALTKYFEVSEIKIEKIGLAECNPYRDIKIWKL